MRLFRHNCDKCKYLGSFNDNDTYYCPPSKVISRYGNGPCEYCEMSILKHTGLSTRDRTRYPLSIEALDKAVDIINRDHLGTKPTEDKSKYSISTTSYCSPTLTSHEAITFITLYHLSYYKPSNPLPIKEELDLYISTVAITLDWYRLPIRFANHIQHKHDQIRAKHGLLNFIGRLYVDKTQ